MEIARGSIRKPADTERPQLERRLARLREKELATHLEGLSQHLVTHETTHGKFRAQGLRLRRRFAALDHPIPGDYSDRKAPPREQRPPAARIATSRGSALRLELTALALAQLHRRPGAKAHLSDLGIPISGHAGEVGWADLIGSLPPPSHAASGYVGSRHKRARTVRSALDSLEQAGLVSIPGGPNVKDRYENFALLKEVGAQTVSDREEYVVPTLTEPRVFTLPADFVLKGWLHVLEDSEINALLMMACTAGASYDGGQMVFPGEVRLLRYGLHRAPFSTARKTLEWFGLIEVEEIERHDDGRAEDNRQMLHRVKLVPQGFSVPALETTVNVIQSQLER